MCRPRTALLFQDGNFVGREYRQRLMEAGREPDVTIAVGRMKPESIAFERERTAGRWNPPAFAPDHRFDGLKDPALLDLLRAERIDLCIQGGVGILKAEHLAAPRLGWINVHPGKLPAYRGNSCPEWALAEGHLVFATAHLIDTGIDTGPVICDAPLSIPQHWSYPDLRANLYAHCAAVLIQALARLDAASPETLSTFVTPQDETGARYLNAIPADKLELAKSRLRPQEIAA